MIREICKDEVFLAQIGENATEADLPLAADLRDTLAAHQNACVGMAANMIGVNKRAIIFNDNGRYTVMFNPKIIQRSGPYRAEESCLSLSGSRSVKRWRSIRVRYRDEGFRPREGSFSGFTAEIIQHEIDHCNGVII